MIGGKRGKGMKGEKGVWSVHGKEFVGVTFPAFRAFPASLAVYTNSIQLDLGHRRDPLEMGIQ